MGGLGRGSWVEESMHVILCFSREHLTAWPRPADLGAQTSSGQFTSVQGAPHECKEAQGSPLTGRCPRLPISQDAHPFSVASPHPKAVALPPFLPSPGRMMGPKGSTGKKAGGGWGAHLVGFWVLRCCVVVCVCQLGDLS